MLGNVSELVSDTFSDYITSPMQNPPGPANDQSVSKKVVRGGNYGSSYLDFRAAARHYLYSSEVRNDFGFRCAQNAPK